MAPEGQKPGNARVLSRSVSRASPGVSGCAGSWLDLALVLLLQPDAPHDHRRPDARTSNHKSSYRSRALPAKPARRPVSASSRRTRRPRDRRTAGRSCGVIRMERFRSHVTPRMTPEDAARPQDYSPSPRQAMEASTSRFATTRECSGRVVSVRREAEACEQRERDACVLRRAERVHPAGLAARSTSWGQTGAAHARP